MKCVRRLFTTMISHIKLCIKGIKVRNYNGRKQSVINQDNRQHCLYIFNNLLLSVPCAIPHVGDP